MVRCTLFTHVDHSNCISPSISLLKHDSLHVSAASSHSRSIDKYQWSTEAWPKVGNVK